MENQRLLTIEEVARLLNVSTTSVRRWVKGGKLVGRRAGVQWRFDPDAVREAFDGGLLAGATRSEAHPVLGVGRSLPNTPRWAGAILSRWRDFLGSQIDAIRPDHVVVNDRRGAKVWSLLMGDQYAWGENLWHSGATEVMDPPEMSQLFGARRVLVFDEMLQRGRQMVNLRQQLEGAGALVTSLVCIRRRSHVEAGKVLELNAVPAEDLDDKTFSDRAAAISRLVHLLEPPLDVDHLVVKGALTPNTDSVKLLERLAGWGNAFAVWPPDSEHNYLAMTLDRPQFFEAEGVNWPQGFSVKWDGPCKIRIYVLPEEGDCYCSFVVFPQIEASDDAWKSAQMGSSESRGGAHRDSSNSRERLAIYSALCADLALKLLNDFVNSGAAADVGVVLSDSPGAVDVGQLRATFGPTRGDELAKRARAILRAASAAPKLFPVRPAQPMPLLLRKDMTPFDLTRNSFDCRRDLLAAIPAQFDDNGDSQQSAMTYRGLLERLAVYPEPAIGRALDFELDSGTVKPLVEQLAIGDSGPHTIVRRAFCRGEFGVWFEWNKTVLSSPSLVIQRTAGVGPTVVEGFLQRSGTDDLASTHFHKVFANLQHDWREGTHEPLYLGWRPYKYGPLSIAPIISSDGEYIPFQRFLMDLGCLAEIRQKHGMHDWRRYKQPDENVVNWRDVYRRRTTGVTRAHVAGLVRLYAAIHKTCKSRRPQDPRGETLALFQDPLIVLGSVRNERVAYICGWFEVSDWLRKGEQVVFPLLGMAALNEGTRAPGLTSTTLEAFAAPARLLLEKVEMYRNLPYLREQIVRLVQEGDFEAGEVLLETVDVEPRFVSSSPFPMANLEWAGKVMRAFSSMTRQVATLCQLDTDARGKKARQEGVARKAVDYLSELVELCPELAAVESPLRETIAMAEEGVFKESTVSSLEKAFRLIATLFTEQVRVPDPRPRYERDRERLELRDGLISRLQSVALPPPYAIAVADIRNVRNLPRIAEIFGSEYDQGLKNLLEWIGNIAREASGRATDVFVAGQPADNLILVAPRADELLSVVLDIIGQTTKRLAEVDTKLFAPFGLLRAGMAWRDEKREGGFRGVAPGLIAYELGDKHEEPLGSIRITEAVFEQLSVPARTQFEEMAGQTAQGRTYRREWVTTI